MNAYLLPTKRKLLIVFMLLFIAMPFNFYVKAARIVTWSGINTNFVSKEDVTINKSVDVGNTAITCLNTEKVDYCKNGGSTSYLSAILALNTEKIDSIRIIWKSAAANQYVPVLFAESTTFGSVGGVSNVVTATNGGWVNTPTIVTSGGSNCSDGHLIKFPQGVTVKSIWIPRGFSWDPVNSYTTNTIYPKFYARINSVTGTYTNYTGFVNSNFIGELAIYISDILVTTPLSTPIAQVATSINSSGFTANWTAVDNTTNYTVKIYKGANEIISARQTDITTTNVSILGLDINTTYTYTVTAIGDGITYGNSAASSPITVRTLNTAKAITSFTLLGATGIIDENAKTIAVEVPFGTDLSSPLTPTISISEYATLVTSVPQQFIAETPITFTVQAEDGSTQDYSVTVSKATVNQNANLSNIEISLGTLNPAFSPDILNYTVQLPFANTTIPTVTATKADYRASIVITDATTLPGTATVLVTAEDVNITKTYTINFTKAAPSTACAITGFSINGVAGVMNESEKTITVTLPGLSTNVTALVPTINVSALATISPASGVAQDFTTPKNYTITAQDITVNKTYSVIVVLVNDSYNGPFPYISAMTPTYQVPFWITGYETYDAERVVEGSCKTQNGTIRLGAQSSSYNQLKLKVASCGTFKVGLSASGGRTISLTNNKNSAIASTTLTSNVCKTLEVNVNSNVVTELYVNILAGTGGTNVHSIEISSYGTSALTEKESISFVAVQENNLLVIAEVGSKVTVLAINGNIIYKTILKNQEYKIPVFLNRGCYIVRINDEVHKIVVK